MFNRKQIAKYEQVIDSQPRRRRRSKQRGSALLTTFIILTILTLGATTYISSATQTYQNGYRESLEIQTTPLCEAASQTLLCNLWVPFKINQNFTNMDALGTGASITNPLGTVSGTIPGGGNYSAGMISYYSPNNDPYTRIVIIRCVGWLDMHHDGRLDPDDPCKTVDVTSTFTLQRSQVFDYTYFINNYGWMDGFSQNDLIVNGDMRANGNFAFTNGSPTVNGSVYASQNQKLVPPAAGLVNTPPVKMNNSTYLSTAATNNRMRQGYNSAIQGAYGSSNWENWRDFIFDTNAQIDTNRVAGAAIGDSSGIKNWSLTSQGGTLSESTIDSTPTQEVVMPDLSNLTAYETLSQTYVDTKTHYQDGSANANYGQGAYVQTWNPSLNGGLGAYQTITTNGVYTGSVALVGSALHPIKIHGPVTITQDAVIKGNVSGQGTIYTGRNVQMVGSIIYNTPPSFQGTNQTSIDNANEHADMLALAARGSVIMGDTSQFTYSYPLQYMEPPFTHARYDDNGNLIPAYNATNRDSTGMMLYQSTFGDSYIHSIASPVNQIDAVLYTNFVGGGDIGTGGVGVNFNGSIISKDEAMVIWSLPMKMNYDGRIRERNVSNTPLIDLSLPRSPAMLQSIWQDRGFSFSQF